MVKMPLIPAGAPAGVNAVRGGEYPQSEKTVGSGSSPYGLRFQYIQENARFAEDLDV